MSVMTPEISARNRPADGTGFLAGELYTSALRGTVALIRSPTPASLSAFWMFSSAGKVTFMNDPLYAAKNGSLPTATYLHCIAAHHDKDQNKTEFVYCSSLALWLSNAAS